MPITAPAHQVVVLPLLGKRGARLAGTALLIGTVLPDLAFVVGGYALNVHSHRAYGPLIMAPLGVFLYVWCEALLVRHLCPTRGLPTNVGDWAWAMGALLIGAYSHILLDGFTHPYMWPASVLYPADVAYFLQVAISIVGSVIVLAWLRGRVRAPPARLWLGVTAGALVGLAIGLAIFGWPETRREAQLLLAPFGYGVFTGATLALTRER